ncbi:MAG: fatty acid desaturase [Gammaproteobacteria bacterium]|jgi:fatty acid desaturase
MSQSLPRNDAKPLTIGEVRKKLLPELPDGFFNRAPHRVVYLLVAFGALALNILVVAHAQSSPYFSGIYVICVLVNGNCLSFAFFYFHEAQHGAVLRDGALRFISTLLAGAPFLLTPTGWRKWHAYHHRYTSMAEDFDRQRHPEFDDVNASSTRVHVYLKQMHYRKLTTYFVLLLSIASSHAYAVIKNLRGPNVVHLPRTRVLVEYAAVVLLFCTPLVLLPIDVGLLGYLAPVLIANLIASTYVISNHCASAVTVQNYPLLSATSVYLLRRLEWSHMHFGRHVEHHLFPSVSHDKLATVSKILRVKFADDFKEASLPTTMSNILSSENAYPPIVH